MEKNKINYEGKINVYLNSITFIISIIIIIICSKLKIYNSDNSSPIIMVISIFLIYLFGGIIYSIIEIIKLKKLKGKNKIKEIENIKSTFVLFGMLFITLIIIMAVFGGIYKTNDNLKQSYNCYKHQFNTYISLDDFQYNNYYICYKKIESNNGYIKIKIDGEVSPNEYCQCIENN